LSFVRFKAAMTEALYGADGFFRRSRPSAHFRTSALASPLFAQAIATLLGRVDEALGHPDPFDLVDVGAGRGELLTLVLAELPFAHRVRGVAVEIARTPDDADPRIAWTGELPRDVTGALIATEWLDNVPVDVAEVDDAGVARYVGDGSPLEPADAAWLERWWPLTGAPPGARAEIGWPRDEAWTAAVRSVRKGIALTVDYGHHADTRPLFGTLAGFRDGREVEPVPDGSCDLTAAVAFDAIRGALDVQHLEMPQRTALTALGITAERPPLALASTDPAGYVRALARTGEAAELTDPNGLGAHLWLIHWV
jgi:SAM-dependent MidA family methyltransferase